MGEKNVGKDFDGNATFGLSVRRVKEIVTATATKNFTEHTSEFSAPKKVASSLYNHRGRVTSLPHP